MLPAVAHKRSAMSSLFSVFLQLHLRLHVLPHTTMG